MTNSETYRAVDEIEPSGHWTVQVYGDDAGGLDLDFEASSLEEARKIAAEETIPGTRGTEIFDPNWVLVEIVGA